MANITVVRGDSYAIRRPLFPHALVDEVGEPFPLTNCTVRTTFKVSPTDPVADTTDETAVIKGTLIVDAVGVPTTQTKLFMVGAAADGTFELRLTASETRALPINAVWASDVELIDGNGETFTFFFTDTVSAIDGYTNRTSG